MPDTYSLDEIEVFDRIWTDDFAKDRGWEKFDLRDPVQALEPFFAHLPGKTILDAGCGWARYVSRFIDQGLEYTGLDHSIEMLHFARASNPGLNFIQGSIRHLPFPDNHFDGVWSCCVLSGIPKAHVDPILSEHMRVLKPGGVLMITLPSFNYTDEVMGTNDDGTPSIYQAHYVFQEFLLHLEKLGGTLVASDDAPFQGGWMFFLIRK